MNIPTYKTFEEKSKHFQLLRIENVIDLENVYKNQNQVRGIYRGVNNSSFKIYSSKQREFFSTSENKNYISQLKNNEYIQKYFKLASIPKTELSYYSILQHYGKPTPLIDFTFNFQIALFFALEQIEKITHRDVTELDSYFSIYFIKEEDLKLIDSTSYLSTV